MNMMQPMNQPGKLSSQDLQNYFGWPPPPVIESQYIPVQRQNQCLQVMLIVFIVFLLCSFASILSDIIHNSFPALVFFVLGIIFVGRKVLKKSSVSSPLPSDPSPPPPPSPPPLLTYSSPPPPPPVPTDQE